MVRLTPRTLEGFISEEEKGYLEYADLAQDAEDMGLPPSLVEILEEMANDELKHSVKLERIKEHLLGAKW